MKYFSVLCTILLSFTILSASLVENECAPNERAPNERAPMEMRAISSLEYRAIEEARTEAENKMILLYGESLDAASYNTFAQGLTDHKTTHKGSYHTYSGVSEYADQIELEDGSMWFVLPAERSHILEWFLGDSLAILKGDTHSNYRYRLHNERTNHIIDVEFSAFPYLGSFYRLTIKDINKEQRYVLLSDGSKWILPTNWFEQEVWMKWYIGDTIIIGTNDQFFYSLFRPDILINVTCSATYTPSKCVN